MINKILELSIVNCHVAETGEHIHIEIKTVYFDGLPEYVLFNTISYIDTARVPYNIYI